MKQYQINFLVLVLASTSWSILRVESKCVDFYTISKQISSYIQVGKNLTKNDVLFYVKPVSQDGNPVVEVKAVGEDINFSISAEDDNGLYAITASKDLADFFAETDATTNTKIVIQAKCKDSTESTLSMDIRNMNLFPPVIESPSLTFAVKEIVFSGTIIGKFDVTDADKPEDLNINCKILENPSGEFSLVKYKNSDSPKGRITFALQISKDNPFDYASKNQYSLIIEASSSISDVTLTTNRTFTVNIENMNLRDPEFKRPLYTSAITLDLTDGTTEIKVEHNGAPQTLPFALSTSPEAIEAFDRDTGINAALEYSIEDVTGGLRDYFEISAEKGEVRLVKVDEKLYSVPKIIINLKVQERESPQRWARATLQIDLNTVRPPAPQFAIPMEILKNTQVNKQVAKIQSFSMLENQQFPVQNELQGTDASYFSVDSDGNVTLSKDLEEGKMEYKVQLISTSLIPTTNEASQASTLSVAFRVVDFLKETPIFNKSAVHVDVVQNTKPSNPIYELDIVDNRNLQLEIIEPEEAKSIFSVEQSGKIFLQKEICQNISFRIEGKQADSGKTDYIWVHVHSMKLSPGNVQIFPRNQVHVEILKTTQTESTVFMIKTIVKNVTLTLAEENVPFTLENGAIKVTDKLASDSYLVQVQGKFRSEDGETREETLKVIFHVVNVSATGQTVFPQSVYVAELYREDAIQGSTVMTITANVSPVNFSIEAHDEQKFAISPDGKITLQQNITEDTTLTIKGRTEHRTELVQVKVHLVKRKLPIFSKNKVQLEILETTVPGSVVYKVETMVPDVQLGLTGEDESFKLEGANIKLISQLMKDQYVISVVGTVSLKDGTVNQETLQIVFHTVRLGCTGTTIFPQSVYVVEIYIEVATPGSTVITLNTNFSPVKFEIKDPYDEIFSISESGKVTLSKPLIPSVKHVKITIQGTYEERTESVEVNIYFVQLSESIGGIFPKRQLHLEVLKSTAVGSTVYEIETKEQNVNLSFLDDEDHNRPFTLDGKNLKISAELDKDEYTVYIKGEISLENGTSLDETLKIIFYVVSVGNTGQTIFPQSKYVAEVYKDALKEGYNVITLPTYVSPVNFSVEDPHHTTLAISDEGKVTLLKNTIDDTTFTVKGTTGQRTELAEVQVFVKPSSESTCPVLQCVFEKSYDVQDMSVGQKLFPIASATEADRYVFKVIPEDYFSVEAGMLVVKKVPPKGELNKYVLNISWREKSSAFWGYYYDCGISDLNHLGYYANDDSSKSAVIVLTVGDKGAKPIIDYPENNAIFTFMPSQPVNELAFTIFARDPNQKDRLRYSVGSEKGLFESVSVTANGAVVSVSTTQVKDTFQDEVYINITTSSDRTVEITVKVFRLGWNQIYAIRTFNGSQYTDLKELEGRLNEKTNCTIPVLGFYPLQSKDNEDTIIILIAAIYQGKTAVGYDDAGKLCQISALLDSVPGGKIQSVSDHEISSAVVGKFPEEHKDGEEDSETKTLIAIILGTLLAVAAAIIVLLTLYIRIRKNRQEGHANASGIKNRQSEEGNSEVSSSGNVPSWMVPPPPEAFTGDKSSLLQKPTEKDRVGAGSSVKGLSPPPHMGVENHTYTEPEESEPLDIQATYEQVPDQLGDDESADPLYAVPYAYSKKKELEKDPTTTEPFEVAAQQANVGNLPYLQDQKLAETHPKTASADDDASAGTSQKGAPADDTSSMASSEAPSIPDADYDRTQKYVGFREDPEVISIFDERL